MLGRLGTRRPETLVRAALGVDAAAVAVDADWACVLTTDPITTAAAGAGRLAVHVVRPFEARAAREDGDAVAPQLGPDHVAFRAQKRKEVDAFYKAAMAAGGRDNGPPGLRPHYHENYYGAFVLDPDGHNIEVVCHTPE